MSQKGLLLLSTWQLALCWRSDEVQVIALYPAGSDREQGEQTAPGADLPAEQVEKMARIRCLH